MTSGDTGYIEEEEAEPVHEHSYELHVQDFSGDKYFITLRVCICRASKVGELNIRLTNTAGETLLLSADEYGRVDYSDLYGDWLVTIYDEDGGQLKMFDLSAGETEEESTETPDESVVEETETPDESIGEETGTQDDVATETPDESDEGEVDAPEDSDESVEEDITDEAEDDGGSSGTTAAVLLILFVLLVGGAIAAWIIYKKKKNEN